MENRKELELLSRAEGRHLELSPWESYLTFGSGLDQPRVERQFSCQGEGIRFIRRVTLKTVIWGGTVVIGRVLCLLSWYGSIKLVEENARWW